MIERLEAQKKLTANQWKLICTANLADLLDFFDLFLIGYVTAALTKEWSLTYLQGGAILMASGIGAPPGAWLCGWLGDKIGRRTPCWRDLSAGNCCRSSAGVGCSWSA